MVVVEATVVVEEVTAVGVDTVAEVVATAVRTEQQRTRFSSLLVPMFSQATAVLEVADTEVGVVDTVEAPTEACPDDDYRRFDTG